MTDAHTATDERSDIQLPVQTVDHDAVLSERLTDNVLFNVIGRYAQKDADGDRIEDWGDIFERVAKNLAVPVAVHADENVTFDTDSPAWADWVDFEEDFPYTVVEGATFELDEEIAPYIEFEGLTEEVSDELEAEMREQADEFETLMRTQQFMPNSPTLMNAGTELQQLSACFVVEPGDSMIEDTESGRSSILEAGKEAGSVFKSGGGVGYPFHHLRPKGTRVSSTGGVSSGPLSFMEVFDTVCGTVKQGGRRRGAQMGIMHVQHPDIGRFVTAKRGEDRFTNFNISAGLTDEFVEAVENDDTYTLYDPREGWDDPEPFTVVPETAHFYDPEFEDAWNDEFDKPGLGLDGKTVESNFWRDLQAEMQDPEAFEEFRDRIDLEVGEPLELPARFVWQLLIDGAHNNGEPGFVDLDEINHQHSFDVAEHPDERIHATNPCAEQPLANYEACNLGHVNLSLLVDEDAEPFDDWLQANLPDWETYSDHLDTVVLEYIQEALDMEQFADVTRQATRFLDNVVTMSNFPLDQIGEQVSRLRKIGVGMMGLHQCLLQLGVDYGSEEGRAIAGAITRELDRFATFESQDLAAERGTFPGWEDSKWAELHEHPEWARKHAHKPVDAIETVEAELALPVRNHKQTTVAPTGTTSMIADTSGGCEPIYNVAFFKNVSDDVQGDEMLVEFDDYFLRTLEANDVDVDAVREEAQGLMMDNAFDGPSDLETVPDAIADVFVTADQLSVEDHILMQAAIQEWIGSGVSKTLNCANDTSIDEVGDAIQLAVRNGIKGATVYRTGSREEQVKTTRVDNKLDDELDDDELLARVADRFDAQQLADQFEELHADVAVRKTAGDDSLTTTEVSD